MREAENLVQGNGFQYDGIAGYRSWFANWPILYPVMIAGVMLITGANAYLASKIVAMVTVFYCSWYCGSALKGRHGCMRSA